MRLRLSVRPQAREEPSELGVHRRYGRPVEVLLKLGIVWDPGLTGGTPTRMVRVAASRVLQSRRSRASRGCGHRSSRPRSRARSARAARRGRRVEAARRRRRRNARRSRGSAPLVRFGVCEKCVSQNVGSLGCHGLEHRAAGPSRSAARARRRGTNSTSLAASADRKAGERWRMADRVANRRIKLPRPRHGTVDGRHESCVDSTCANNAFKRTISDSNPEQVDGAA